MNREWWLNVSNLRALLLWLRDHDQIDDSIDGAAHVLEKPWHWDSEWQAMQRGDAMDEDESEDLTPLLQASVAMARGSREGR